MTDRCSKMVTHILGLRRGFNGVYIILAHNIYCGYTKELPQSSTNNMHVSAVGKNKKAITILRLKLVSILTAIKI